LYFDRTAGSAIKRPEVIEVEGYEAEDGDVEQYLPPWDEAAVAV